MDFTLSFAQCQTTNRCIVEFGETVSDNKLFFVALSVSFVYELDLDIDKSALFRLFPSTSLLVAHLGLNPDPNPNPNP